MNISDRILSLRKARGLSQEEFADKLGVSRQAVSKWESELSAPEIDKIIAMSELFEVTTDYLLKGIESPGAARKQADANVFVIVATALNFIGLVISAAIWYERQTSMALVIGLVFMALGCMIYGVGASGAPEAARRGAKRRFWSINVWLLSFIPMSFIYNILFSRMAAPYPLLASPIISYPIFWALYIAVCLAVSLTTARAERAQRTPPRF